MMTVEVAADLLPVQLDWIEETERAMDDLQRRIDAGEEINFHGWTSANWLNKVTPS